MHERGSRSGRHRLNWAVWRNRDQFVTGRDAIVAFLTANGYAARFTGVVYACRAPISTGGTISLRSDVELRV